MHLPQANFAVRGVENQLLAAAAVIVAAATATPAVAVPEQILVAFAADDVHGFIVGCAIAAVFAATVGDGMVVVVVVVMIVTAATTNNNRAQRPGHRAQE